MNVVYERCCGLMYIRRVSSLTNYALWHHDDLLVLSDWLNSAGCTMWR